MCLFNQDLSRTFGSFYIQLDLSKAGKKMSYPVVSKAHAPRGIHSGCKTIRSRFHSQIVGQS